MLEQLFNIVEQFGQDSVVNNPEVPNEYNQSVLADASKTITRGLQNILAGGGFQNILDLFKEGATSSSSGSSSSGGIANLLKNPIVNMMVGHFMSKLVGKYNLSPSAASNVAHSLIPNSLNSLIQETYDPNNPNVTLDGLINSLTSGGSDTSDSEESQPSADSGGGSKLQDILSSLTGGGGGGNSGGGGFNIQDIVSNLAKKAQSSFKGQGSGGSGGGGIMDMIKGFFN